MCEAWDRWHPDKNHDDKDKATERFKLLAAAYETLSDPVMRAQCVDVATLFFSRVRLTDVIIADEMLSMGFRYDRGDSSMLIETMERATKVFMSEVQRLRSSLAECCCTTIPCRHVTGAVPTSSRGNVLIEAAPWIEPALGTKSSRRPVV